MNIAKIMRLSVALLCLTASVGAVARPEASLSLDEGLKIAERARSIATSKQKAVSIVIVNLEGRVLLSQRMDGASFTTLEVATGKAITSATTGIPTKALEQAAEEDKFLPLKVRDLVLIAGGVPILKDGKTVAGLGVSGADPSDDNAMAEGGLAAIAK